MRLNQVRREPESRGDFTPQASVGSRALGPGAREGHPQGDSACHPPQKSLAGTNHWGQLSPQKGLPHPPVTETTSTKPWEPELAGASCTCRGRGDPRRGLSAPQTPAPLGGLQACGHSAAAWGSPPECRPPKHSLAQRQGVKAPGYEAEGQLLRLTMKGVPAAGGTRLLSAIC